MGFIAVGPIVMVLLWVLGTMALVGIPYNVITTLITALSSESEWTTPST